MEWDGVVAAMASDCHTSCIATSLVAQLRYPFYETNEGVIVVAQGVVDSMHVQTT